MKMVYEQVMPPASGLAVDVKKGQHLRIINVEGGQVVDTVMFNLHNLREKLSCSYSRSRFKPEPGRPYMPHDYVQEGDTLMSTIQNPMMTIVKETMEQKGVHDVHFRCCNRKWFELYGAEPRDGCLEILAKAIEPYGLSAEDVPDPIDFFETFYHDCKRPRGQMWVLEEPIAKAGDYVELLADMDVMVAFSNCPDDTVSLCNGRKIKPLKVEIYEPE